MVEKNLLIAAIGLDEAGLELLEAASKIDFFEIVAVADRDAKLVEKTALLYKCDGYDDFRQLLIQKQFDCLLVAAGLYSCDEYVRAAMKKGCNILKLEPAARNFEEAVELVKLAIENEVKVAVANPTRFAQSFVDFAQYLRQKPLEQPFLIDACLHICDARLPHWYNDPQLSGGGVLLRNCFHLIDQMIINFSLPEQVYCLCTNSAADKQQRVYLTEETAVVTMRFNGALTGTLTASRQKGIGPDEQFMRVHCREKILTVSHNRLTMTDNTGRILEERQYSYDRALCLAKVLNNFALSILLPQEHKLKTDAQSNLSAMAVIEAAYLSARTGMPEEPARILQMIEGLPAFAWPGH